MSSLKENINEAGGRDCNVTDVGKVSLNAEEEEREAERKVS